MGVYSFKYAPEKYCRRNLCRAEGKTIYFAELSAVKKTALWDYFKFCEYTSNRFELREEH